jgi:hypothetical protein
LIETLGKHPVLASAPNGYSITTKPMEFLAILKEIVRYCLAAGVLGLALWLLFHQRRRTTRDALTDYAREHGFRFNEAEDDPEPIVGREGRSRWVLDILKHEGDEAPAWTFTAKLPGPAITFKAIGNALVDKLTQDIREPVAVQPDSRLNEAGQQRIKLFLELPQDANSAAWLHLNAGAFVHAENSDPASAELLESAAAALVAFMRAEQMTECRLSRAEREFVFTARFAPLLPSSAQIAAVIAVSRTLLAQWGSGLQNAGEQPG